MRFITKRLLRTMVLTVPVFLVVILLNSVFVKKNELANLIRNQGLVILPDQLVRMMDRSSVEEKGGASRPECPYSSNAYAIYFIETKMADGVGLREACVVEAAARKHPTRDIFIMHTKPFDSLNAQTTALVAKHFNVRLVTVDLSDVFQHTPLQSWIERNRINDSQHPVEHMSDALRLALLYRCGGIYLDTDALAIRPLNGLRNAIGWSSGELNNGELNNAIMVFDKFHPYVGDCMTMFANDYQPFNYSGNGPQLASKVMRRYCARKDLVDVIDRPQMCRDITVMSESAFYPYPWQQWRLMLAPASESVLDLSDTFTVHLYGQVSSSTLSKPGENSLLESLAQRHCPMTYREMVEQQRV